MVDTVVICGASELSCRCVRPVGHEGLHECDPSCRGSWRRFDGRLVIGRLPTGTPGSGRRWGVTPTMQDDAPWETITDSIGTYRQRWVGCEPPGPLGSNAPFVVTAEEWNADHTERTIYTYRLSGDPETTPYGER